MLVAKPLAIYIAVLYPIKEQRQPNLRSEKSAQAKNSLCSPVVQSEPDLQSQLDKNNKTQNYR